jgi:hypothetical protein
MNQFGFCMHVLLILNIYCQFTDPTGWNSGLVIDYYWNNMHKDKRKSNKGVGRGLAPTTSSQNGIQALIEQLILGRPPGAVCHAPLRYIH